MPKAIDVKPNKWKNILILFDNGNYSFCWGNYDGSLHRKLGSRWNDNYPRQGNNPTWYVECGMFSYDRIQSIKECLKVLKKDLTNTNLTDDEITNFIQNCDTALDEINLDLKSYTYGH